MADPLRLGRWPEFRWGGKLHQCPLARSPPLNIPPSPLCHHDQWRSRFPVAAGEVVLDGTGWIDIHEIRRAGSLDPLAITWPAISTWRADAAAARPAPNIIALGAYDFDGALIATARSPSPIRSIVEPSPRDFLRITELHYHPADPATARGIGRGAARTAISNSSKLKNIGAGAAASEWRAHSPRALTSRSLMARTLAGGQFAVIVRNRAAFEARYGTAITMLGEFVLTRLSNGGETIALLDSTGAAIQSFTYDDAWFPSADGPGWSMVVAAENAATPDLNSAAAWADLVPKHGNPGAPNGPIFSTEFEGWRHQEFHSRTGGPTHQRSGRHARRPLQSPPLRARPHPHATGLSWAAHDRALGRSVRLFLSPSQTAA